MQRARSVWQQLKKGPIRVTVLGSGNWGTTVAKLCAANAIKSYIFHDQVTLFVHPEQFKDRQLVDWINNDHENPLYLPGVKLPTNIHATSSIDEAVCGANLLVFVLPHQFIPSICDKLVGKIDTESTRGLSLVKGLVVTDAESPPPHVNGNGSSTQPGLSEFPLFSSTPSASLPVMDTRSEDNDHSSRFVFISLLEFENPNTAVSPASITATQPLRVQRVSSYISSRLHLDMAVCGGANVANEIAREQFSEATVGFSPDDVESAQLIQQLLDRPYFRIDAIPDLAGVEWCGALKNVVALAAGFVDGLELGSNTKAAVMRLGMMEMRKFAFLCQEDVLDKTFWESCGVADVITTCLGGRNRKCAEAFVRSPRGTQWDEIEKKLLKGQKLQGTHTARDVYRVLEVWNKVNEFPLFDAVYRISFENADPHEVVKVFMHESPRVLSKL